MGVSYSVHVGPFIRAKYHFLNSEKFSFSCPNTKCKNNKKSIDSQFCGVCGTQNERMVVGHTKKRSVHFFDVMQKSCVDEMAERLCLINPEESRNDEDIIINNHVSVPGVKHRTSANSEDAGVFLTDANFNVEAEKTAFKNFFKKEIDVLVKTYDAVTVEWGVIIEAS